MVPKLREVSNNAARGCISFVNNITREADRSRCDNAHRLRFSLGILIIQNAYVRNEPIRIKSARLPNMMAQLKWVLKTG